MPQIEVTFEIDAIGILNVSAEDIGTGKAEKITITITNDTELESTVNEAPDWLEENPYANIDDLRERKLEVEQLVNPIMKGLYQSTGPSGATDDDFDFGDDELRS